MLALQFESIANFGAVIDRLGEFQEVLESSATSRSTSMDTPDAQTEHTQAAPLIQLVDHPGDNGSSGYRLTHLWQRRWT